MYESVKTWVFNVVTTLIALAVGVAWYFYSLSRRLKDQLFQAQAEKQLGEAIKRQEEAHQATLSAEEKLKRDQEEFQSALDELSSNHRSGGSDTVH